MSRGALQPLKAASELTKKLDSFDVRIPIHRYVAGRWPLPTNNITNITNINSPNPTSFHESHWLASAKANRVWTNGERHLSFPATNITNATSMLEPYWPGRSLASVFPGLDVIHMEKLDPPHVGGTDPSFASECCSCIDSGPRPVLVLYRFICITCPKPQIKNLSRAAFAYPGRNNHQLLDNQVHHEVALRG